MTDAAELAYRKRLRDDLVLYARDCLRIRTKTGNQRPLILNPAQKYLHERLEAQRKRSGRVRALVLKGRQQGISTYVQARYYHRVTHSRGVYAFILTHEDEATKSIFGIARRYHDLVPVEVRPSTRASNARELIFDTLDGGYRVATAGTRDTGRSATIQLFHGSEVAFWPHAETHAAGVMQAVAHEGTEVILESTSAGPKGFFHAKWREAEKSVGDYEPIFVPWWWSKEYRLKARGFEATSEERAYGERYNLTDAQLAWRRHKIIELGGVWRFRAEYPATPDEAFESEVPGALWTRETISKTRVVPGEEPAMRRMAVAIDPATTSKATSDEWGIVWGGQGVNGHGYVMGDETLRASPKECCEIAVAVYNHHRMEQLIYEANQGGDMVPTIIREIDPRVHCVGVHASRGKRARAEPIAALYEKQRVHHVGNLPALEDEQCSWDASHSNESPNRIDACVWLLTKLLLAEQPVTRRVVVGDEMDGRQP
jgi:hypothetical protein